MKICLVTAFPPSGRQLNEYAFHIARELQRDPRINLTVLADELTNYEFATDGQGNPLATDGGELPGFHVVRCWSFNQLATPFRLLRTIEKIKPDVVWFNLVFSTFATPDRPVAAFAGLCVPALSRLLGCYAHVTLHHILEHVDFAGAGVRQDKVFRLGSELATRVLLKANSVSVLLSAYQRTLLEKYSAQNILLGTHGVFTSRPSAPDFSRRGNPDHRILAIGHWGTYKRLETLVAALPAVLERVPSARLIIAGANHHTKPGYWESIRDLEKGNLPIEFRGYVAEDEIPELFRSSSVVVMPYDSATGSSGPAHQACEFGVPMVCADIPDFRTMAKDEEMAISFYKTGDAVDLADKLAEVLESTDHQHRMAEQNFSAAVRMTMPNVVRNYLRWFELAERKRALSSSSAFQTFRQWSRNSMRTTSLRFSSAPSPASVPGVAPASGIVRNKSRAVE